MSRFAMPIGAVMLLGLGVAVGQNSFTAQTQWGEPNLTGVWRAVPLGARPGSEPFALATLEGLYTSEARTRMEGFSAEDDPIRFCYPPAFPRAAMLGHPIQIIQSPGLTFVLTEAYPVSRIIPTTGRAHTEQQ